MIEIASRIIEQQEGDFEPEAFRDRYEDALRDLIKAKQKGEGVKEAHEPEDTNVVDLMEALRASLQRSGASERRKPEPAKKKAPAKKTAAKAKEKDKKPAKKRA